MNSLWPSFSPFEILLELRKGSQARRLEFPYPAVGDRMDRHRVDEMQLLAALPPRRQQVGFFENGEMLRHGLAGHLVPFAQLAQRLAVLPAEAIQQPPAIGIRQGAEDRVLVVHPANMQLVGCLSRAHGGRLWGESARATERPVPKNRYRNCSKRQREHPVACGSVLAMAT